MIVKMFKSLFGGDGKTPQSRSTDGKEKSTHEKGNKVLDYYNGVTKRIPKVKIELRMKEREREEEREREGGR